MSHHATWDAADLKLIEQAMLDPVFIEKQANMLVAHTITDIASKKEVSMRNGTVMSSCLPAVKTCEEDQESHTTIMGSLPLDCTCSADIYINGIDGRWVCHVCTFINHPELFQCEICDTFCVDGVRVSDNDAYDSNIWNGATTHSAGHHGRSSGFSCDVYSKLSRVSRSLKGSIKLTSSPTASGNESDDLMVVAKSRLQRLHSGASSKITSAKQAIFQRARRPSADLLVSQETIAVLDALQADLNHRCIRGNDMFEVLLLRLWHTIHQNPIKNFQPSNMSSCSFERISNRWVELGFQREDPQTDFRGGGILALKCLVYVFEKYPHKMLAIVEHQQPSGSKKWYPVCAAGINLTCMLADILQLGTGNYTSMYETFWKLFAEPNGFYELYYWGLMTLI